MLSKSSFHINQDNFKFMSLAKNIKAAQMDLVKELGIDQLPREQQEELLVQISEVMQQRIVLRLVGELPENKKEEFGKIVEENKEDPQPMENFLRENIPDVEEKILDEIGKYKVEVKEFLSQAQTDKDASEGKKEEGKKEQTNK